MKEKVEQLNKTNKLQAILQSTKAKYVIGTVLLSALGVALPRIFHVLGGSNSGATFLPMHIAVLIAALVFGVRSGSIVAGTSIVMSHILTGMPTVERLPFMLIELVTYAVVLGLLNKKFHPYVSLIGALVIGRLIYAGVLLFSTQVLGANTAMLSSVMQATITGLPGLAIQLACIPLLAKGIKKGIKLDD